MKNPLICPDCSHFRYLKIEGVRFEKDNKSVGIKVPFFKCTNCGNKEPLRTQEHYQEIADKHFSELKDGEFTSVEFTYENKKFSQYDHLEFDYSSEDYFLIPGLFRGENDGYLTPVFFDKDVLLYYNNHPNYTVRLSSFSSGNIYFKDEPMFGWGFGINRNGKIFKWLGDLNEDFEDSDMKSHLKRFQASNIQSDHDIYSKFYLSQIPSSPSDAFQQSDNENKVFQLKDELNKKILEITGHLITQVNISELSEYYKSPILDEREQIFNTYISLNKYLVENIQVKTLKEELITKGKSKKEIKSLGSLKTFQLYLTEVLNIENIDSLISPLYVLNDLRQLQGHLMNESFESKYTFCKERLFLKNQTSDFEVYEMLIKKLIEFYSEILNKLKTASR